MNNKRELLGNEKIIKKHMRIFNIDCYGDLKRMFRKVAREHNSNNGSEPHILYESNAPEIYLSD